MTYRASQDSTESLTSAEVTVGIVGKANLTATTNPTSSDDCMAGYQVGSRWLNTSLGNWYLCTSATASNAVWTQVSGISEGDVPTIPLGSSEGVTSLQPFDGDTELDLDATDHIVLDAPYVELQGGSPSDIRSQPGVDIYVQSADNGESSPSGGAWLFSGNADGGATGDAGVGTGNSNTGQTGAVAVYTGDSSGNTGLIGISTGHSSGGNSGNIGIVTGDADGGDSGNLELSIGTADGQRGSIILNAPNFSAPSGFHLLSGSNPIQLLVPNQTADNGDGSNITLVAGPGGGGSGNGGTLQLTSGEAPNGVSGNITLTTGAADTRGNIIIDAPKMTFPQGMTFLADTTATGQPLEIGSSSHTSESVATSNVDLFSGDITSDAQRTGAVSLGSGFVTGTAQSGIAQIYTGDSSGGDSGDIQLTTGAAGGTRGNIVLDGASFILSNGDILVPNGGGYLSLRTGDATDGSGAIFLYSGSVTESNSTGTVNLFSGDQTGGTGQTGAAYLYSGGLYSGSNGDSGEAKVYSGDATGTGNSGAAGLATGNAGGNSGDITLHTGSAGGTRGNIVLDAPTITSTATEIDFASDIVLSSDGEIDLQGTSKVQVYTLNTSADTGSAVISTGNSATGNSGDITLRTGTASGTRGNIILDGPIVRRGSGQFYADPGVGFDIECSNVSNTNGNTIYLQAGIVESGTGNGGDFWCQSGDGGPAGGNGGLIGFQAGQSTCAGATGGEAHLVGGQAAVADAHGGAVLIVSGQGLGTGHSGDINIRTGPVDTGTKGNIILTGLPTADPHVAGALWNSSGVLHISAG